MTPYNRRKFLKTSGSGLAIAATSNLWTDLLHAGNVPDDSAMLFEQKFGVSREHMIKLLQIALSRGGEFSELFFEYRIANAVRMEEGIIKSSSENISLGVGIRVIREDQTGYAYTNDLTFEKMKQAALTSAAIANSKSVMKGADLTRQTSPLDVYDLKLPMHDQGLTTKVDLITKGHNAALAYDPCVKKVEARLTDEIRYVTIVNSEGLLVSDARPQVRLFVSATAEEGAKRTTGYSNAGGRVGLGFYQTQITPDRIGIEAAKEAKILLSAEDAVAGEQPVVLGSRQSGVMIHEAVGHPLEADGNRKKTSIMWDRLGKMVANDIVTIYDDPTIPHYRGSMNVDDEGVIPFKTPLIEKGKLVGFIQDRLSAKLMNMEPNGHGRRETFENIPIPRMTNTVLAPGDSDAEEIIKSVKKGFYADTYQGGMVSDSGKFTFSVNLGYMIEDGKLSKPLKNATLIGTNVQILNEVSMIGNDTRFFLGTCGKDGQGAPCTAGTPTLKLNKMTVGGRA